MSDHGNATSSDVELAPEEREFRRFRVLKRAVLGFGDQFASQPCIVRDICDTGAKLEIQELIALPRHFTLHVEIDGFKVECELRWQRMPFAGVQFTGPKQHSVLGRKQVLGDAETALSEQFQKDFELREKMAAGKEQRDTTVRPVGSHKPAAFGKRHFEG